MGPNEAIAQQEKTVDIHTAAEAGNIEAIKKLAAQGADLNAKGGQNRWPPIHYAAYNGHANAIKELAALGADIKAKSSFIHRTALHYAAEFGKTSTIRELVALGADVNATNGHGYTALHVAAKFGKTSTIRELVALGADINAKTRSGGTPLFSAASDWGRADTVKELISLGAHLPYTPPEIVSLMFRNGMLSRSDVLPASCPNLLNFHFEDARDDKNFAFLCKPTANQSMECQGQSSYKKADSLIPAFLRKLGHKKPKKMDKINNLKDKCNAKYLIICRFDDAATRNRISCENGKSYSLSSSVPSVNQSNRSLDNKKADDDSEAYGERPSNNSGGEDSLQ